MMFSRPRRHTRAVLGALALFVMVVAVPTANAAEPTTERVSIDSGSGGGRELPAVSEDASRVVFVGRGESNQGVWLRDRTGGTTHRLTTGSHFNPAISGDGTKVAYVEYGTNRSVWLIDITNPAAPTPRVRVDVASGGGVSGGLSDYPSLDRTGNLVAFQSTATNLDPTVALPTSGGPTKVYLRDVGADTTEMISVDAAGIAPPGNAVKPDITPDGDAIAFASEQVLTAAPVAAPLAPAVPGDEDEDTTETFQQVYVRNRNGDSDRANDTIVVASVNDADELANGANALTYGPTVSDDGTTVAFESDATNLVPFDTNGRTDAFVHDITGGTTVRVSERSPFDEFGPLVPVSPVRLTDTRILDDPLGPGESITVQVRGAKGVPATATAAALNVTVTEPTTFSYLTVYPTGEKRPVASNLNARPGEVDANAVTAKLGADGSVRIFNAKGTVHVVVDLNGYYNGAVDVTTAGGGFVAVAPARLLDTRTKNDPLGPGETLKLQVAGVAGVPATATAAALNVTVAEPTAKSYLTVYPTGETRPVASNVNVAVGQVVANSVIAKLGADGSVTIFNANGSAQVIVDLNGFFDPSSLHGGLTPVTPARLLDTRTSSDPLGPKETLDLRVLGVGGIPRSGVSAVVLNVTAVTPTTRGNLAAHPFGITRPLVSNLNFAAGENQPNQVLVAVGDFGKVSFYNPFGDTHVVVDVMGWYSGVQVFEGGLGPAVSGDGTGVAFESVSSSLTADDRNGVKDAFVRTLATSVTERVSLAIPGGTEATGTRTDGNTGEVVPQNNGVDVSVGTSPGAIAFVSNGDLAGDRPIGEEVAEEISTEPASFMRIR